jgi:glycosyltransferase involved in cell wall biosynthesis
MDVIDGFRAIVINNGIDQSRFSPFRDYKNIRQELGFKNDDLLLLFIARFTSHKQPLALINAFAKALKVMPGLKLLMVGEGDERVKAELLLKNLGIEESVLLINFRQDVPDILSSADIFILPSLWEGLPIGLLEAMSMGKAIIATNVDGTKEVIEDEKNGLLIELTNLEQNLSEAIIRLAKDPELRKKYSLNAMDTVNSRFNAQVMTREIEKVYLNLTHKK